MREERGKLSGDCTIDEQYTLWGMIVGNVTVGEDGKFYLRGSIYGDLTVQYGGRVHIFGNLQGSLLVMRGAKVIHSGLVGGDITNRGEESSSNWPPRRWGRSRRNRGRRRSSRSRSWNDGLAQGAAGLRRAQSRRVLTGGFGSLASQFRRWGHASTELAEVRRHLGGGRLFCDLQDGGLPSGACQLRNGLSR